MDSNKVVMEPSPPPYRSSVKQTPVVVATVVASVCATALLVVSILGGVYINDLKNQVKEAGPVTEATPTEGKFDKSVNINIEIDNEGKSVTETVNLDELHNEEVDMQYDEDGQLEGVSVIDYSTNIYGSYSVAQDVCYITLGEEQMYESVSDLIDHVYNEDFSHDVHYNSSRANVELVRKPIRDHSILPDNLKPYCENKEVYWFHQLDSCSQDHEREKRACYWVYLISCRGCGCPGFPDFCGTVHYYDLVC